MDKEMTIDEAASAKGVTKQAVHLAIRQGRLKARIDFPPGSARGRWKILRADLDQWEPASPSEKARRAGFTQTKE